MVGSALFGGGSRAACGLEDPCSATATLALLGLLGWFGAELTIGGGQVGRSERALAGAEAVWPLMVVLSARLQSTGAATG